ncbi:MAG: hypothetical protein HOJ99_02530 [Porticoccaceae bacterium]|jgi:quercetin dioxygenase-like cupin family protein|nr:hypothetical protein [Porticoccaceae bacterium]MBT5577355.1 hypothetical protein [Porticoccaceae bacterium]
MISNSTFTDEAEAYEQIKAAGYYPFTADYPAVNNDFHWHDFDSLTYITAGELTVTERDSGETKTFGPGTKLVGVAGVVHRERSAGYSAIFGLAVDPKTLSKPVEKPV